MSRTRKLIIGAIVILAVLFILMWINMYHEGSSFKQTGFSSTQTIGAER